MTYLLDPISIGTIDPFGIDIENSGWRQIKCPHLGLNAVEIVDTSIGVTVKSHLYHSDIELIGSHTFVSERFRSAVSAANLRGISFSPIVRFSHKHPTKHHESADSSLKQRDYMSITGLTRAIVDPRSKVSVVEHCAECNFTGWSNFGHGVFIDESIWATNDFARLREMGGVILISANAHAALSNAGLDNYGAMDAGSFKSG